MRRLTRVALAVTLVHIGAGATAARAEVDRCSTGATELAYASEELAERSADSGWFPASSPAQLRLVGRVVGRTSVDLNVDAEACWHQAMSAAVPERAGGGEFEVAYGAQLQLFARIDTTVLGQRIHWEGEIPIPFIPEDLMLAGRASFDAPLLASPAAAEIRDLTDPVTVLSTDVLSSLISVTGISGGLHLDVTGGLTARYQTERVDLAQRGVTAPDQFVTLPAGDRDGALELPMAATGAVEYDPDLTFSIGFNVKVFGIAVVDLTFADLTLPLPSWTRTVELTGDDARVPLPVLADVGPGARVDLAGGGSDDVDDGPGLTVGNAGLAGLELEVLSAPPGVGAAPLRVEPGERARLGLRASAEALAAGVSGQVVLATSDPDFPTLTIEVGVGGGTDPGEAADHTGGAGGCQTSGGAGAGQLGLLLGLAALVRIRRRARP